MRDQILSNLEKPLHLEQLYRRNKSDFKRAFTALYPEISGNLLANFWYERLHYESEEISWGSKKEFLIVVLLSLVAGFFAKLPDLFPINEEFYYPRNISFLIFPFLTAYFAWKNRLTFKNTAFLSGIILVCLVYINVIPGNIESDSLLLACIHLPLLLWAIFGLSFTGNEFRKFKRRLEFLRFNGDLLVMSTMLVLAGILMTGITLGLFELISFRIEDFYFRYVVIFGLPAVPIAAAFLTQTNPQLVNKVSPVIARMFSPLVLVMLIIYLGAIIYSGKDPYNDREFLLLFNLLLIGVMALIFFSVAEGSTSGKSASGKWVLLPLSVVTVVVNAIALSAILFRISEWGFTPNRVAVLGANVLILIHLLLVTLKLYQSVSKSTSMARVGKSLVTYIPVYLIWIGIVVFLFPVIFDFE